RVCRQGTPLRACRHGPPDPRDGLKTVPCFNSPLMMSGVLTPVGWALSPLIVACAMVCVTATTASSASLYDPALRFRMLPTEHFVIYFHRGEEPLAGRLAVIAEDTWHAVQQALRIRPPARTDVVLVDQSELANGFATPLPTTRSS